MRLEDLAELIQHGEGQQAEFKSSFSEQNKAIISLCAFTHAQGGVVLVGVRPDGNIVGASVGANTLENFANTIQANCEPPLHPSVEKVTTDSGDVYAVTIEQAAPDQLFHAFGNAYIRVGRTNQRMSSQEQRSRLRGGSQEGRSDDNARPRFAVEITSLGALESAFTPEFRISHFSGDRIPSISWRLRGPRFAMNQEQIHVGNLERMKLTQKCDISRVLGEDSDLTEDEMGLEIAFAWRGEDRSELHRWPLARGKHPTKAFWEIGAELFPSKEI